MLSKWIFLVLAVRQGDQSKEFTMSEFRLCVYDPKVPSWDGYHPTIVFFKRLSRIHWGVQGFDPPPYVYVLSQSYLVWFIRDHHWHKVLLLLQKADGWFLLKSFTSDSKKRRSAVSSFAILQSGRFMTSLKALGFVPQRLSVCLIQEVLCTSWPGSFFFFPFWCVPHFFRLEVGLKKPEIHKLPGT